MALGALGRMGVGAGRVDGATGGRKQNLVFLKDKWARVTKEKERG